MKLNKILALALSGVMAVSMLAGCSGKTDSGDEGNQPPVVATDIATIMNNYQDTIEFKTSTDQSNYLTSALKEVTYDDIKAATATATVVSDDSVLTYLQKNMPGKAGVKTDAAAFVPKKGQSSSQTLLYILDADKITEEYALISIVEDLVTTQGATMSLKDVVKDTQSYSAEYTGEVSVAKVSKTDADGKNEESAYYVLFTVTQTVGSTALDVQS